MTMPGQSGSTPSATALDRWPRWRLSKRGVCAVTGWHLSVGGAVKAQLVGRVLPPIGLLATAYFCWGFCHVPAPLVDLAGRAVRWLVVKGVRVDPVLVADAVYLAAWAAGWVLLPLLRWAITYALYCCPLLWRRTALRFSADTLTVGTVGRRRYSRGEINGLGPTDVSFALLNDPDLAVHEANQLPPALLLFRRQTLWLYVKRGPAVALVATFAARRDGERFLQAAAFSLIYPLARPPRADDTTEDDDV